jgi:hypothetical protein
MASTWHGTSVGYEMEERNMASLARNMAFVVRELYSKIKDREREGKVLGETRRRRSYRCLRAINIIS